MHRRVTNPGRHHLKCFEEIGPLPPECALLTPRQVAAGLKISPRTLASWTAGKKPRLNYVKIGYGTKRFVLRDILEFIEKQRVKAA